MNGSIPAAPGLQVEMKPWDASGHCTSPALTPPGSLISEKNIFPFVETSLCQVSRICNWNILSGSNQEAHFCNLHEETLLIRERTWICPWFDYFAFPEHILPFLNNRPSFYFGNCSQALHIIFVHCPPRCCTLLWMRDSKQSRLVFSPWLTGDLWLETKISANREG